jgi:MFS family permease
MHEVGAAWLMTSLSPTPFMVAVVQTASTLPFFLLALPSGALADILDRRRLLLAAQVWMLAASVILGILTLLGITTPTLLLALTFFLSLGAAINGPAWQAIIPEIVDRDNLPAAITLGSVGFNIARAVGPVFGGLVVAAVGPGATFLLNAVSFLGVVAVLRNWNRPQEKGTLPEERLLSAMRAGIRFIRHAPEVRAVFIHTASFSFFASALWAFLPIIAREYLKLSSLGYGMLLGFFGAGALLGAPLLPRFRNRLSLNVIAVITTALFAIAIACLAHLRHIPVLALAMVAGGAAWLILFASLIAAVQGLIPSWVRGRVLSVHMLIFFGGLAGGSALWGCLGTGIGIKATLSIAAISMILAIPATWPWKLSSGEGLDLTPSLHWPALFTADGLDLDEGPVLVVVEYHIDPARSREFSTAVKALKTIRRRDGAIRWNLFRDVTDRSHYFESFIVESWGEHLRQHERMTVSDTEIETRVMSFHIGKRAPRVMHFIAEPVASERKKG